MNNIALRKTIENRLRTDCDLDAFLIDHYPEVYFRTTAGMTRTRKVNLLFEIVSDKKALYEKISLSDKFTTNASTGYPRFIGLKLLFACMIFIIILIRIKSQFYYEKPKILSLATDYNYIVDNQNHKDQIRSYFNSSKPIEQSGPGYIEKLTRKNLTSVPLPERTPVLESDKKLPQIKIKYENNGPTQINNILAPHTSVYQNNM